MALKQKSDQAFKSQSSFQFIGFIFPPDTQIYLYRRFWNPFKTALRKQPRTLFLTILNTFIIRNQVDHTNLVPAFPYRVARLTPCEQGPLKVALSNRGRFNFAMLHQKSWEKSPSPAPLPPPHNPWTQQELVKVDEKPKLKDPCKWQFALMHVTSPRTNFPKIKYVCPFLTVLKHEL